MKTVYRYVLAFAALGVFGGLPYDAAAQHEHHGAPEGAVSAVLSGRVLGEDGTVLSGAVVQLFHMMGEMRHLMAGGLSDQDGRFVLRAEPGTYLAMIDYLGYVAHEVDVTVPSTGGSMSLGEVRLVLSPLALEEITVNAQRAPVRMIDATTVVDASVATSAGGSVGDLIRTVPGLEVSPDGQITMRGSPGVLVLVNGRRTPLEGPALLAFLRQMPATALDHIEAGTSASVREEAGGAAGIVNLVFRGSNAAVTDLRSFSASLATEDHYMGSAAFTGALGSAISWDGTYSFSSMRPGTEVGTERGSLIPGDPILSSRQDSDARAWHRLHSLYGGASALLTPSTTLSGRGSFSWMKGAFDNRTLFNDVLAAGPPASRTTESLLEHTIPSADGTLSFNWRGGAGGLTQLGAEASASSVDEEFVGDYEDGAGTTFLGTRMKSAHQEYRFRADGVFEGERGNLEFGWAFQLRSIDARYSSIGLGTTPRSDFNFEDEVQAGYVSASGKLGGADMRVGARLESEVTEVAWEETDRRTGLHVLPSVEARWPSSASGSWGYHISYGRRIVRPESGFLNPYSLGEDDMNSVVGNPNLRPEIIDQIEIGAQGGLGATTVNVTPFVRWTADPIRPLKAVTESGRSTTTLHNLSRTVAAGMDGSFRAPLGDRLTASVATSLYRLSTEGLSYDNAGLYASVRATVDVRVGPRTTFQIYGYGRTSEAIEQGKILPNATSEVALTHRWGANERGRLTLRVSDPFRSDDLAYRVREPAFVQESRRRESRPLATFFVSWTVGGTPREDAPDRSRENRRSIF